MIARYTVGMASFSHTLSVNTSATQLWALVSDVTRLADLFPYMEITELQTPATDCWSFWRTLTIPNIANLHWREESQITNEGQLAFQATEGDLTTFAGHWQVTPQGAVSTLTLMLDYEVPAACAPNMPAVLVSYVMNELFKSICQRVREVAEEEAA